MGGSRKLCAAISITLLIAGCQAGNAEVQGERPPSSTASEQPRVLVTQDVPGFPPPCRPLRAAQLALDFFDAVNAGESNKIEDFFSETQFMWYSMTDGNSRASGRHRVVRDRDNLAVYFGQRFRAGEHLELSSHMKRYSLGSNPGSGGSAFCLRVPERCGLV